MIEDEDYLLGRTLQILMEKAKEDGVISDDEVEIMKQLNIDIPVYVNMLKKAREDGIITLDEEMRLGEYKQIILQKASNIALQDQSFEQDEKEVLVRLANVIANYFP